MKTFTLVLAFVFTMNVSVASANSGVKDAIDEFVYVMTVEGAALDTETAEQTINEFTDRLLSLGVTRSEIIQTTLAAYPELSLIHAEKLSQEEAMILLKQALSNGQQGASWDGLGESMRQFQIFGIVALVAVLLAGVVNSTAKTR